MSILNFYFFFLLGKVLVFILNTFYIIFLFYTSIFKHINYVRFVAVVHVSKRIILNLQSLLWNILTFAFIVSPCCHFIWRIHFAGFNFLFCKYIKYQISSFYCCLFALFFIVPVYLQLILNAILARVVHILLSLMPQTRVL